MKQHAVFGIAASTFANINLFLSTNKDFRVQCAFHVSFKLISKQFVLNKMLWYKRAEWGTLLVAQLVEELRYKPERRRFDSRCCY
jgi:hypothetical protein